jgi:hypothetical protein
VNYKQKRNKNKNGSPAKEVGLVVTPSYIHTMAYAI